MDLVFTGIIVVLFVLAVFDLSVGVSNDAVNFLNSAIGSKAASLRTIIIVAAVGVLAGAVMSNGMMDIARHGIFRPEHFSFYELMCIFMAVMVTDIILLDVFNTLGMPTSTTVSMVFELLGAAFATALFKMAAGGPGLAELLNTEKALSVIIGIFLSVAIAFVFGTLVQLVARAVFTFEYRSRLKWKAGIFGGLATTAIIYFMLIKGMNGMAFMTPEVRAWVDGNTALILGGCFVVFTIVMQVLHWCGVNVLKVTVLTGTLALAMAFAGNDLVNFIGVPLSGLSSYLNYTSAGGGDPHGFMMGALNGPADTPAAFLVGAGVLMVVALATSKKARHVTKTEIGLGSQGGQDGGEMFGSSGIARRLVRVSLTSYAFVMRHIPGRLRRWLGRRFDTSEAQVEDGAAFDLVRATVNLMLAGILIALGTSLRLPLSTTFVTFMVAMGTSLADRAWTRESAVFRITGVISVIGGWFITAGAAFIGAGVVATLMNRGGTVAMVVAAAVAVFVIVRSNRRFRARKADDEGDRLFQAIISSDDKVRAWEMLRTYIGERQREFVLFAAGVYGNIADAFMGEDFKALNRVMKSLEKEKDMLKVIRRKETLCLGRVTTATAMEKSAWFHLGNNSCMSMNYSLWRIAEACCEHVGNNFRPLPHRFREDFAPLLERVGHALSEAAEVLGGGSNAEATAALRRECDQTKDMISQACRAVHDSLRLGSPGDMGVTYIYLNLLQESQEMVSALRKLLRASHKLSLPQRQSHSEASAGAVAG